MRLQDGQYNTIHAVTRHATAVYIWTVSSRWKLLNWLACKCTESVKGPFASKSSLQRSPQKLHNNFLHCTFLTFLTKLRNESRVMASCTAKSCIQSLNRNNWKNMNVQSKCAATMQHNTHKKDKHTTCTYLSLYGIEVLT